MGKSTMSMAIFNSKLEGKGKSMENLWKMWKIYGLDGQWIGFHGKTYWFK